MKKENICKECGSSYGDEYLCDTCGMNLFTEFLGIPITISFGYGSDLDGEKFHFCSEEHTIQFLAGELRKKNPRTNIEFGKEK